MRGRQVKRVNKSLSLSLSLSLSPSATSGHYRGADASTPARRDTLGSVRVAHPPIANELLLRCRFWTLPSMPVFLKTLSRPNLSQPSIHNIPIDRSRLFPVGVFRFSFCFLLRIELGRRNLLHVRMTRAARVESSPLQFCR